MKLPTIFALFIAVVLAAGNAAADTLPSHLRFNYVGDTLPTVGVVRVFDDGKRTILQFADLEHAQPSITDASDHALPFRTVGNYAVLDTLAPMLRIRALGHDASTHLASYTPPPAASKPPVFAHEQKTVSTEATSAPKTAAVTPVAKAAANAQAKPKAAPATVSAKAVAPLPSPWTLRKGEMLSGVLARWSQYAGWNPPQWRSEWDFPIQADARLDGTFQQATAELLNAYRNTRNPADHPLHAYFYLSQRLIVVVDAGHENADTGAAQ